HGPNFVEAIRNQIRKGTNPLRVVSDQRGRPTYTPHLARAIARVGLLGATGIVHYSDEPECTWYDFACAIHEEMGSPTAIVPVSSDQFPRPAKRREARFVAGWIAGVFRYTYGLRACPTLSAPTSDTPRCLPFP